MCLKCEFQILLFFKFLEHKITTLKYYHIYACLHAKLLLYAVILKIFSFLVIMCSQTKTNNKSWKSNVKYI